MWKYFVLIATITVGSMLASTSESQAAQCVYNDSGTSLSVTWYNQNGNKDDGATNHDVTFGRQACQNNSNLGYAVIECNGCAWAEGAAKGSIIAAGIGAFGVCVVASGGECAGEFELFGAAVAAAVQAVPPAFNGKLVVVPDKGKTAKVGGNAFGLKME